MATSPSSSRSSDCSRSSPWIGRSRERHSASKSSPRGTDEPESHLLLGRRRESGVQGHLWGEMHPLHVNPQGLGAAPCGALLGGPGDLCCKCLLFSGWSPKWLRSGLRTRTSVDGIPSGATAVRPPLRPHESLARGSSHLTAPRRIVFVCRDVRPKLRTKTSVDGIPSGATAARRPLRPHESLAQRLSISTAPRAAEMGAYLPAIL